MNYIELANQFWKKDIEYNFSDKEIALYFYLLNVSNSIGWKNPFGLSNAMTSAKFGWGKKSFDTAKNKLQIAGLITFKSGDGRGNVYQYTLKVCEKGTQMIPLLDTLSEQMIKVCEKGIQTTPLLDTLSDKNKKVCEKGVQKIHLSATLSDTLSGTLLDKKGDTSININKTKEIIQEEEKAKTMLVFPFSTPVFFEKWNLLVSMPKWKNKLPQSLQLALDLLKKYEEDFVMDSIEEAIQSEWAVFKGTILEAKYQEWKKLKNKPKSKAKQSTATSTRFVKPTVDELKRYCQERKNAVDPQKFMDHYQSVGWVVGAGGKKMKDWKAAVRNWERNNFDTPKGQASPQEINQLKEKEMQIKQDKEQANQIKKEVQDEVFKRIKEENPSIESKELIERWENSWKKEYIQECKNQHIHENIYKQNV